MHIDLLLLNIDLLLLNIDMPLNEPSPDSSLRIEFTLFVPFAQSHHPNEFQQRYMAKRLNI